jgi:hypothetical protein
VYATAVAAVVVALMMVTSPAAATSPPMKSSKTLKAPYSGSVGVLGIFGTNGCGGKISLPVTPSFNLTSGDALASLNVSGKSCGGVATAAVLTADIGVDLNTTFKASSTGTFKVTVTWSFDYQVYLAAKETKKGETTLALASVAAAAYLYNQTKGTTAPLGGNESIFENGTKAALHTYKYTVTYSASLKLVKGDVYYVGTGVVVEVEVEVAHSGGSATASVNMGSTKFDAVLTSVVQP